MPNITTAELLWAVLGAVLTGAISALAVWSQTDALKVIIIGGLAPALTYLATVLGLQRPAIQTAAIKAGLAQPFGIARGRE